MRQKSYYLFPLLLIAVVIVRTASGFCQLANVKFSPNIVDFGRIVSVMYPAKTVEFTNLSKEKLAILVIEKGNDVKVGYEHRFYGPGEKGIISLFYEAGKIGEFNEQIKIYTNIDNDPYVVNLKGICISVEECFPDMSNLNLRNIMVVNKLTQAPVPFAPVGFIHNFNNNKPIECKMDKNGKAVKELPIGQYNAQSVVNGFEPYNQDFFLPRSQPNILIELMPVKVVASHVPVTVPPVSPDQIPELNNQSDNPSTELPEDQYVANNIVLLLDVSSSMLSKGKFTLLQQSINNLVMILRPIDNVSIITYASNAKVVIDGIPGDEKDKIMGIVQELKPYGTTQGVKGLNTAYDLATDKFINGGNNQIILATDGQFTEQNVSDEYYQQFIDGYTAKGIKLSILGFGVNEAAINRMKKMTAAGKGSYIHIESETYIKDVLINEIKARSFMGK